VPATSRLMTGLTTTGAARVANEGRIYSLPEPSTPWDYPPAPSTGIAELESRLCRAGDVGRSEHQALAVVGVVLVGIAITEHPLPLSPRFSSHFPLRQHQQLAQNGIIALKPEPPQRENMRQAVECCTASSPMDSNRRAAPPPLAPLVLP
jgi:hypothetical protein